MQQGRVLLDSDWNEQADVAARERRMLVREIVGDGGVPRVVRDHEGNPTPNDFALAWDDLFQSLSFSTPFVAYVEGLRVEYEGDTFADRRSFLDQPFLPAPEDVESGRIHLVPGSSYLLFLDAWEQLVGALEDEELRDPALGGPDTTVRTRTAWRLRLLPLATPLGPDEDPTKRPEWLALLAARPTGRLVARANPDVELTDPCRLYATGGYRRLENQLYRVEVHVGGDESSARFKWSRENGSVASRILSGSGNRIEIAAPAPDATLGYSPGDWVEILSSHDELLGRAGPLVRLITVEGTTLVFDATSIEPSTAIVDFGSFGENAVPMVRRWDTSTPDAPSALFGATGGSFVPLEDGIEVGIGEGTYAVGDFWTIPARTATGDVYHWPVDDGYPASIPPDGTRHHHAPLAAIDVPEATEPDRIPTPTLRTVARRFSSLTELRADDVAVLRDGEGFPPYENVQQAIESLSHGVDLKFHNARLHGWGIVDGLQVHCLPVSAPIPGGGEIEERRKYVILENGYAIAPTGPDVVVTRNGPEDTYLVPVVDEALAAGLITEDDLGSTTPKSVALYLTTTGEVEVAAYDPEATTIRSALEGTMLMDLYEGTLLALVDWVRGQLDPSAPPNDPTELVGPARMRLSSLLTLFWQYVDADAAGAFLSGKAIRDTSPTAEVTDDLLLYTMWSGLKELIGSETFCGQFDGVIFPDYDVATTLDVPEPRTVFGAAAHRHLRIHPTRPLAYSIGYDDEIHVYRTRDESTTLRKGVIAKLKFPSASAKVQDVAFSEDGATLYAVALIGDNADTMFARCAIGAASDAPHTWGATTILCDVHVTSIAAVPGSPQLCAVAKTRSLGDAGTASGVTFRIDPDGIASDPTIVPLLPNEGVYPTGKLVVTTRVVGPFRHNYAYVSAHSDPTIAAEGTRFDRIYRYPLFADPEGVSFRLFTAGGVELEDMAANDDEYDSFVYATSQSGERYLYRWDIEGSPEPQPFPLGTESVTHLYYEPGDRLLYAAMEDDYEVLALDVRHAGEGGEGGSTPLISHRHPVQIGPVSLGLAAGQYEILVLNHLSATITVVPLGNDLGSRIDPVRMEAYRRAAIQAFVDLLGGLLQYLKDAICEQILVQYRVPGPDARLWLGAVSIKSGLVYQVCNFHRRKYVHTFPNVEYWLSALPVLPLLRWGIGFLCCYEIPNLLDFVPIPSKPTHHVDSLFDLGASKIRYGEEHLRRLDVLTQIQNLVAQLAGLRDLGLSALDGFLGTPPAAPPAPPPSTSSFVGLSADEASRSAAARGVSVSNVVPARKAGPMKMLEALLSSRSTRSGTNVDLYTDRSGNVRFVQTNASPGVAAMRGLAAAVQPTSSLDELRAEMATLRETLSAQAREIESLRDAVRGNGREPEVVR